MIHPKPGLKLAPIVGRRNADQPAMQPVYPLRL
jgi:hypothetical protein